jgi:hypothetical protein
MERILYAPTMPATSTTPNALKESRKNACHLSFHRKNKHSWKRNGWFKLLSINTFFNVPLGLKTNSAFEKVIYICIKPKQSTDKSGILIFASLTRNFSSVTNFNKVINWTLISWWESVTFSWKTWHLLKYVYDSYKKHRADEMKNKILCLVS